ncbi:MAG: TerB family tellurite resistance protein [Bacteroidetes bacterium]|jgi:hypothetical protein|nr:TerB family tellurite resistance protein [Bacteroidota bacterium]
MSEHKLNKVEAGYHMLQLLSVVDGKFSVEEDLVIRKYLVENYPFHVSLDGAMDKISILKSEDYIIHFQKCMDDFYQDSTQDERVHFMDFAVKLVSADEKVTPDENLFLNTLFDAWDIEHAE